ncbi:hypothetical protein EC991_003034 [Linnemannia zychae]|nr:hypothetical protein EC991_003034 [Linnemannia zychae]
MNSMYSSKLGPQYVRIEPHLKTQFARFHPNITQFFYDQPDTLPKEFWEVVETEWVNLELLDMHGIVEADAVDTFWRICSRVRAGTTLGPLTYDCLREMYFGHLRDLRIGRGYGVSSRMAQEILTECIHLDRLDVPYIFVQDIATAPKPWGCLNIGSLTVFIAKQPGDNVEWEGQVFRQISKLRRLESLELQDSPCRFVEDDISPEELKTLDLRLPSSSSSAESSNIGTDSSGGDIRCWSSLVLMQEFTFETDHQSLGMEEALWMVDNWKDLWCICGKFTAIKEEDTGSLKRLFHDKDISHY